MKQWAIIVCMLLLTSCAGFDRSTVINTIAEINHSYPAVVSEGIVAQRVEVDDDWVVFSYVADNDRLSQERIDAVLRKQILVDQGHEMKRFMHLIERCSMGLKEVYYMQNTDKKIEVIIIEKI